MEKVDLSPAAGGNGNVFRVGVLNRQWLRGIFTPAAVATVAVTTFGSLF